MKKEFLTFLILFLLVFPACRKSEISSSSDSDGLQVFGSSEQTQEAIDLITEANGDLQKVKDIYRANENGVQILTDALNQKDTEKIKKVADDLVYRINDGMLLGESAIKKIEKVQSLNVNDTFKEYLQLKESALRKQLEAFEIRRQAGRQLRDAYGEEDKLKIKIAIADLKEKEEKFKDAMEKAREMSLEANQLAKESMQKTE